MTELPNTTLHAHAILAALAQRRQIESLSGSDPGLDLPTAYHIAAEVRRLREARGERVLGRKIGFTNTTIWPEYGVHAPIWGSIYDTTLLDRSALTHPLALATFVEPRIEPEIVFGLARAPEPGMDAEGLIGCLAWVAQGFEVVQSLFPDWRFSAADAVAAFGLHGALVLVLGERVRIEPGQAQMWRDALSDFTIMLFRNDDLADRGSASNVLGGGPLVALAHLVDVLAKDPESPPLAGDEIVTTGTLTRIRPIAAGETWRTHLNGLPLPALDLTFA